MSQVNASRPAAHITLRNPGFAPLTDAQIQAFAPCVFQNQPHATTNKRYQFVNTSELVTELRQQGLMPTEVSVYTRRNPEWRPYAMHMIRFTMDGARVGLKKAGDVAPQIVLRNSHDSSSPFELYGGLFRMICSNGLIVSDSAMVAPIRVRHSAYPVMEALSGVETLISHNKDVFQHVDAMQGRRLSDAEQTRFALRALQLREGAKGAIDAVEVLKPRRTQDAGDDLWRVYNRVQENLMRGGLEGKNATGQRTVTHGVNAIQSQLALNAGLWSLAMGVIDKASSSSAEAIDSGAVAAVASMQAIATASAPAPRADAFVSMAGALRGLDALMK
jgi:Domain of unknown function (DUF932)